MQISPYCRADVLIINPFNQRQLRFVRISMLELSTEAGFESQKQLLTQLAVYHLSFFE